MTQIQNLAHGLSRGAVAIGCGKMGGAIVQGWLAQGVRPASLTFYEPNPSPQVLDLAARGARLNPEIPPENPDVVLLAVKPQMMEAALPAAAELNAGLYLSMAAGLPLAWFEARLPTGAAVVRCMPNTPAAVGEGATALVAGSAVDASTRALAESLMRAVGVAVWLTDEAHMDAVTAISGSGPAYVFHMIEALTAAGEALGLPSDLAETLARATVSGAGALAAASEENAAQLRVNVTSPGGTTAAGLEELMREGVGLTELMCKTAKAAARRSRELAGG